MKLTEAIASNKAFARSIEAETGDYSTAADFLKGGITLEDFNATDYELEPEVALGSIPLSILTQAWNDAKGSSNAIAIASQSQFFTRMVAKLEEAGVTVATTRKEVPF